MAIFGRKGREAVEDELERHPTPQGYVAAIERCVAQGALDRARALARRARERFPNSERVRLAHQNLVRLERQTEIRALQQRLAAGGAQSDFERLASVYLNDLDSKARAMELAVRGMEQHPRSDALALIVGQIRLERFAADGRAADFDAARSALEQAVAINAQNLKARLLLGRLWAEVGFHRKAQEVLEPLVAESGDPYAERLLAVARRHANDPELALEEVLRRAEYEGAWPATRAEVRAIFDPRAAAQVDAGAVRQFLDGVARISGVVCAAVVAPDGRVLGARGPSVDAAEGFAAAAGALARRVDDATARMDIGGFMAGELNAGDEVVHMARCREYTFAIRGNAGLSRRDAADALERFFTMVEGG
jgi:tetratricopeptide (TPR) repeat protein